MSIWGSQTAGRGGERTRGGYSGQEYGSGIPRTRRRRDMARRGGGAWEQSGALRSAPEDPYTAAMTQARAQADAERYLTNQRYNTMRQLQDDMAGRRENWYGQFTGSNAPGYADLLPASAMAGFDLMQGRGTGWDQYAALAGAGSKPYDPVAGRMAAASGGK